MTLFVPVALPDSPEPFVLLDDARPVSGGIARLYRDPVEIVMAHAPQEVIPALDRIRAATRAGLHAAGYLHYEAGLALEPALAGLAKTGAPLVWFGLFKQCATFPATHVPALLPAPDMSHYGTAQPAISEAEHAATVNRALAYIRAGDIYQANITLSAFVPLSGDRLAAYTAIRPRAAMAHGAIVRHDGNHILSFSPESFFAIQGRQVETRPMKGTAARLPDPIADAAQAREMQADPKQRAENLMIVDLLRNDLSRVCDPGSVAVPELFAVETYPTIHQMVSRVTGRLHRGADAIDVIHALFPCGSITGAPKIRAMEIIAALEGHKRGVYTGSIGSIDPDGDARFNVAIRTISLDKGMVNGIMGMGSGIVADSEVRKEWVECLAKGQFLESAPAG